MVLISPTTVSAFSIESMNGRRTWRGRVGNCARIELPNVSAVMPVPSETKNTVRLGKTTPTDEGRKIRRADDRALGATLRIAPKPAR